MTSFVEILLDNVVVGLTCLQAELDDGTSAVVPWY